MLYCAMKSRDDKPRRAFNSTLPARTKPMDRGPAPKRSARLASEIAPSRKPVRKVNPKRRKSEFARCYHSRARVAFIKSMPCVVCSSLSIFFAVGTAGACDNAHTETGGMGMKAGYETIVPMCRGHHRAYDERRGVLAEPKTRAAIAACAPRIEAVWQAHSARRDISHTEE